MAQTNNSINNSTDNDLYVNSLSNDGASESFDLRKSRAGGVITSGDVLGAIFFSGYDGSNFINASKITSTSSGTIGAGRVASDLKFFTHPDSVTVATQRLAIASTGAITISTPDSGTALTISGGGLTATGTITFGSLATSGMVSTNGSGVLATTATTDHALQLGNASGTLSSLTLGTSGQVLVSGGAGVDPSWTTLATGVSSVTGTANQITSSPTTGAVVVSLPSAITAPGSLTTTTSLTAGNGFTVTTGTITLTPLSTSGIVVNNASGVISTTATTTNALQIGNVSGQLTSLSTGTSGQLLQSAGASAPAWTTATYPATIAQGDLLYGSAANTISLLNKDTNATRYLSNTGTSNNPAWAQVDLSNGVTGTLPVSNGGSGAATLTGVLIGNGTSAFTGNAITQYNTLVGGTSNAITSIAPSATSGVPYISQGSSANPTFGTAVVAGGGTGNTTFTAYSVICAGTTATGAFQNVSGLGTSGQVLTSNGAGALPTWQAAGGAVSSVTGTANQITASPTTGAVVVSLPSAITAPGSLTTTTTLTSGTDFTITAGDETVTNGDITIGNTDAAVTAPFIFFRKSRSGGVITTGDDLGELAFRGHDGTQFITGSRIRSDSSGTIATNRIASNLEFYTHPDSTTSSTLRMTIASTGAITVATPDSGTALTISGGGETITAGDFTLSSGNILLPTTSSTVGQLKINSVTWLHAYGTNNIWMGPYTAGFSITKTACVGIGDGVLSFNGGGNNTVAVGYQAGERMLNDSVVIGYRAGRCNGSNGNNFDNVIIGSNAVNQAGSNTQENVIIGSAAYTTTTSRPFRTVAVGKDAGGQINGLTDSNILIGWRAGYAFTSTESSNIIIGYNLGTAADNNTIRIGGGTGTGTGQQNKCFISGVYNTAVGATSNVALIDSSNQIGGLAGSANTFFVGGTAPSFTANPTASGTITGNALVSTTTITGGTDLTLTNGDALIGNTDAATTSPFVQLRKSRSGGVITSGDVLGEIDFMGISTGSTYVTGASIKCTSSGTIAANRVASNMVFATHPDSASGSTPTDRVTIASTGAVTIASPDSGVGLTISGGGLTVSAGDTTLVATYGKTIGATTATLLIDSTGLLGTVVSSARFKNNITDMDDASSALMQLRPVTFTFKKDQNKNLQYGLIAEEVAEIMPEIVNYDNEGLPFSVRYHDMPAMLLNEIQKLSRRIEALENQIAEQRGKHG